VDRQKSAGQRARAADQLHVTAAVTGDRVMLCIACLWLQDCRHDDQKSKRGRAFSFSEKY
jgi:hypothetical protein